MIRQREERGVVQHGKGRVFTGNNSATKCSNRLCFPNLPFTRYTISHSKSGYLSRSTSASSALRSAAGAPIFFKSAMVTEYQSDG